MPRPHVLGNGGSSFDASAAARARISVRGSRRGRRLVVEALEPRELLSTYYVSMTGSDGNPGTLAAPFKTIQRAANSAGAGDTVLVRGGVYRETVKPRSGKAGAPVTFQP